MYRRLALCSRARERSRSFIFLVWEWPNSGYLHSCDSKLSKAWVITTIKRDNLAILFVQFIHKFTIEYVESSWITISVGAVVLRFVPVRCWPIGRPTVPTRLVRARFPTASSPWHDAYSQTNWASQWRYEMSQKHSQLTTSAYNPTIVHGCLLNGSKRLLSLNNLFLTTIS